MQWGTKSIFGNKWHIYAPIMNYRKEKIRKQSHLLLQKKMYIEKKFNQGGKRPVLRKL